MIQFHVMKTLIIFYLKILTDESKHIEVLNKANENNNLSRSFTKFLRYSKISITKFLKIVKTKSWIDLFITNSYTYKHKSVSFQQILIMKTCEYY